jgi:pimeloyl-ACP methyl ester carboxylesterase
MTAMDLPGFGKSAPPVDGDHSPKNFANISAELIQKVYPGKTVHLFGNSLGGAISVQLAARYPELIKSLTLISPALPTLYPHFSATPVVLSAIPKLGEKFMERYFLLTPLERARNTIKNTFADAKNAPENWEQAIANELALRDGQPHQLASMLATLRALLSTFTDRTQENAWNLVQKIQAPTMFIYGEKDKLVHSRAAKKARTNSPSAIVRVWSDTAHVAHIEHAERVAKEFSQNLLRNLATY